MIETLVDKHPNYKTHAAREEGRPVETAAPAVRGRCLEPYRNLKVLAIAPHPDDIELGCGATIMRLIDEFDAEVFYLVLSNQQVTRDRNDRRMEALKAGIRLGIAVDDDPHEQFAKEEGFRFYERWLRCEREVRAVRHELLGKARSTAYEPARLGNLIVHHQEIDCFLDTRFPDHAPEIQQRFLQVQSVVLPNLVLLPPRDAHQDHATVHECANREFRKGETRWYYEILQFDETPFFPSLFVDTGGQTAWVREVALEDQDDREWVEQHPLGTLIDPKHLHEFDHNPAIITEMGRQYKLYFKQGTYAERKADLLSECFHSQRHRNYFDPMLVLGNMATRGMQCGTKAKYAEAFQARISI